MSISINSSLNMKKRLVITALVLIALTAVFFLVLPIVHATVTGDTVDIMLEMFQKLGWGESATTFYNAFVGSDGAAQQDVLSYSVSTFTGQLMAVTQTIAASLFIVYTFIVVLREFSEGYREDVMAKIVLRTVLTLMVLIYLKDIVWALSNIGNEILKLFRDGINTASQTNNPMEPAIQALQEKMGAQANGFAAIVNELNFVALMMSYIVARGLTLIFDGIVVVVVRIVSYGLLIELTIRKVFMPLAVLNLSTGGAGMRSVTVDYFKKYVGIYLRMAAYMIALVTGERICISHLAAVLAATIPKDASLAGIIFALVPFWIEYLVVIICSLVAGRKAAQIIDEALGVGGSAF